jgi:hypothetical protein
MAKQPIPISLRLRSAEASGRARKILRELEERDRLQRRVRWLAVKALVSVREMRIVAMKSSDRRRWGEFDQAEAILLKISKRGVP